METLDLTAYRPTDTAELLKLWREAGLFGMYRTRPYQIHLNSAVELTGSNGAVYRAKAEVDFHFKRSDKAKVHNFALHLSYVSEQGLGYRLIMNSNVWGHLDAVPLILPEIFPNRGESVYEGLLYAYSEFWRAVTRPFVIVAHEDVHTDNSDSELSFSV